MGTSEAGGGDVTVPADSAARTALRARYMAYADGFQDGAGVRGYRKNDGHLDYARGYDDGQKAKRASTDAFAAKIGYAPERVFGQS